MRATTCAGPSSDAAPTAITLVAPMASSSPGRCAAIAEVTKDVAAAKAMSSGIVAGATALRSSGNVFPLESFSTDAARGMQSRLIGNAMATWIVAQARQAARQLM